MPNRSIIYALQNVPVTTAATVQYQDMVIDRYNDNGVLWTPTQIAQLGGGAADSRQLFGYVSLGEAEVYRPYWQNSWANNPPSWLGPENPQWDGNYYVKFWAPEWVSLMKAEIDGLMKQGFDGVYFDVVDIFNRGWIANTYPNAEQDMVNLLKTLHDYAASKDPNFRVYINSSGADELLANKTVLDSIDGVLRENLYYSDNGQKQPDSEAQWAGKYLDMALAAGKNVSVVDYVSDAAKVADVRAKATADGYGYYTAKLNLTGINTTGFSSFPQQDGGGNPNPNPDPNPLPDEQVFDFTHAWAKSGGDGVAKKTITDFHEGDIINLSAIDADIQQSGNQAFRLIGENAFTKEGGELRVFHNAAGNTIVTGNIDHDQQAEFKITIKGLHTLDAGDFLL